MTQHVQPCCRGPRWAGNRVPGGRPSLPHSQTEPQVLGPGRQGGNHWASPPLPRATVHLGKLRWAEGRSPGSTCGPPTARLVQGGTAPTWQSSGPTPRDRDPGATWRTKTGWSSAGTWRGGGSGCKNPERGTLPVCAPSPSPPIAGGRDDVTRKPVPRPLRCKLAGRRTARPGSRGVLHLRENSAVETPTTPLRRGGRRAGAVSAYRRRPRRPFCSHAEHLLYVKAAAGRCPREPQASGGHGRIRGRRSGPGDGGHRLPHAAGP